MATNESWESLLQSIHRVGDAQLMHEIINKVARVRNDTSATSDRLLAQESEISDLRAQISGGIDRSARPAGFVYDPPV